MKYFILEAETTKTPTGKTLHKVEVRDEEGVRHEHVAMWGSNWPTVETNTEVEGEMNIQKNGKFTNKTLYPKTTYKTSERKPTGIAAAVEKKNENISKFQDNKELGIKISSTIRMAVDCAIAEGNPTEDNIKKWREFFWHQFDVKEIDFPAF